MANVGVFADTDTLSKLGKVSVSALDNLLRLNGPVLITGAVYYELREGASLGYPGASAAYSWVNSRENSGFVIVDRANVPSYVAPGTGAGETSIVAAVDSLRITDPNIKFTIVTDNKNDLLNPNSALYGRDDVVLTKEFIAQLVPSGGLSPVEYLAAMADLSKVSFANPRDPAATVPMGTIEIKDPDGNVIGHATIDPLGQSEVTPIAGATVSVALTDRFTIVDGQVVKNPPLAIQSIILPKCFAPGTPILMADGTEKTIENIRIGDLVVGFDSIGGDQGLVPCRVSRLFSNVTEEWLILRPAIESEGFGIGRRVSNLVVTPGHYFLSTDGTFQRIDEILVNDSCVVCADGTIVQVRAERAFYSKETAHLYEECKVFECSYVGNAALKPEVRNGWRTYNFEVENLHTYIAGGVRVHNDSVFTLAIAAGQFDTVFHRAFDGSESDVGLILGAIVDGRITAYGDYVAALGDDRYTAAAYDFLHDKIVFSADALGYAVSSVHNTDGGGRFYAVSDAGNSFNWSREVVAVHPDFIDRIKINDDGTVGLANYYGATLTGEIGQALGSSLGKLLGGNSLVGQVAAGTIIGTIGKEIGQALTYGGAYTLDVAVKDAFGTLGGGNGVGALPSAAIGAVSSLLIGELAKELHLTGFAGGLVTTVGTAVTTQLITNAYGVATGATVNGLPSGPAYTMFTGFDPTTLAGNLGGAIGGYLGSTLAGHVMVPHYAEGAIGQSVGSSVGGAIGAFALAGIPVVGPIVGSFIGSFVGGVVGSLAGDLAGNDPESHGILALGADHRFWPDPHSFWGDHGADGDTFKDIATYTALTVDALADFAGVQMNVPNPTGAIGVTAPTVQLRYTQDDHDFFINENGAPAFIWIQNVDDADDLAPLTDAGIMYLTHHVALSGGDPLVRYSWQHSTANNPSAFARRRRRVERRGRGMQAVNAHRGGAENWRGGTRAHRLRNFIRTEPVENLNPKLAGRALPVYGAIAAG